MAPRVTVSVYVCRQAFCPAGYTSKKYPYISVFVSQSTGALGEAQPRVPEFGLGMRQMLDAMPHVQ